MGEVGVAVWEVATASAGSVGADDSRVPFLGEEGLTRCWKDELWPPQVLAITIAWMDEGFKRGG